MSQLRKIAVVELSGNKYAVGKNGHYCLVDETATDAWGNQIGRVIDIKAYCTDPNFAQALIDALGESIEKIQGMKLERERRIDKE